MSETRLTVYLGEQPVGRLWLDERKYFTFEYLETWRNTPGAIPISLSLPIRSDVFANDAARPFFANLLPEEKVRAVISKTLGISNKNDFALLEAIGGECAGAISLWPENVEPPTSATYRPLSLEELERLIEQMPNRPMLIAEEGMRLSLAGAQNKLPVYRNGADFFLPEGIASSSHILKPQIRDFSNTVENEAFCMMLARSIGLPVPLVSIIPLGKTSVYLVERYDRMINSKGAVENRIHQEDFCQALGFLPFEKYEGEGGPSLAVCSKVIDEHCVQPLKDKLLLLRWVFFNLLIGNNDSHAKNISLLLKHEGVHLAPFYDLMCTSVYPKLTPKMAMKLGAALRSVDLVATDLSSLAEALEVRSKLVNEIALEISTKTFEELKKLKPIFLTLYGTADTIEQISGVVETNVKHLERVVGH